MNDKKFFNRNLPKSCAYCVHSRRFDDEGEILCKYKGAVTTIQSCRKYKYDVLKRKPQIVRPESDFKQKDFEL